MARTTESLPNRIRYWRLKRGMLLKELAAKCGTTTTQVQRMEMGSRSVHLDWLDRIATALDVHPGDLLAETANPDLPNERERALLQALRDGGEQLLRTVEAVAETHHNYVGLTLVENGNSAA